MPPYRLKKKKSLKKIFAERHKLISVTTKDIQIVKITEEVKAVWHAKQTLMWLLGTGFLN